MIVLFTDYGPAGPYTGQIKGVFFKHAPGARIADLIADAPRNNPKASAYLLSAFAGEFPIQTVFFTVVDPGVGGGADKPVIMKIDGRWFVGPDNGLFDIVARHGSEIESWQITWKPERLSSSFHGRDLYAPVCAMLSNQHGPPGEKFEWTDRHGWPDDLYEIIYVDHFGNVMTGIRSDSVAETSTVKLRGIEIPHAGTFSDVKPGDIFWYENANGLVEIAINMGSAAEKLELEIGDQVELI